VLVQCAKYYWDALAPTVISSDGALECSNEVGKVARNAPSVTGNPQSVKNDSKCSGDRNEYFDLEQRFRETMSRTDCKPWFVGVWDTVSSVGWIENPLRLPYVSDNPDIQFARHAVSIDERRAFFRNNLWRPGTDPAYPHGPKDLKQVWFPGVHCDVGGGYRGDESGLAKIALEWMLEEAEAHKLLVDPVRKDEVLGRTKGSTYACPDANGRAHESLKGAWNLAELVPKRHFDWNTGKWGHRMNLWRPPNSLVHESAYQRSGAAAAGCQQMPFEWPPLWRGPMYDRDRSSRSFPESGLMLRMHF